MLTQDPIGLSGGVNLYAYAGNNPVGFSDPWGLSPDGCKNSRGETVPCVDKQKMVDFAIENAASGPQGKCARFCRQAMEAGGFSPEWSGTPNRPSQAKDYGPFLESRGASAVPEPHLFQNGDIAVFAGTPAHPDGHIQIYDGDKHQWISDFKQRGFNPYADKSSAGAHTIYRFPDDGSAPATP